jgi:hypothetical protein
MLMDRYVKAVLTVIAVALAAIAGMLWRGDQGPGPALAQGSGPQYEIAVPKAWGRVIGYGSGNLLLEAADGTLREVDVRGKPPEYPKIKTLVRWH